MGLRENIRKNISESGFKSIKAFAQSKKIDYSYLNQFLNGNRRYNEDLLNKIADALEVPIYNLFSDEPLVPKSYAEKEPAIVEIFSDQLTKIEYDKYRTQDDFVTIRILESELSLGPGQEIYSAETEGYALIYKDVITRGKWTQKRESERYLCFRVKGNSMEPIINNKSLVVVDTQDIEHQKKKIYAFWLEGENKVTVKRLIDIIDNYYLINADNSSEPGYPRLIKYKGVEHHPIRGRIVWTWNVL